MFPQFTNRCALLAILVVVTSCSRDTGNGGRTQSSQPSVAHEGTPDFIEVGSSNCTQEDISNIVGFAQEFNKVEASKEMSDDLELPIQYDVVKTRQVGEQFYHWWEEDKVPGFGKDVEGECGAFPIWNEQARAKWLTEEMRADIAECKDAYLVNVRVEKRTLRYLVSSRGTNLTLVSGYEKVGTAWRKLMPSNTSGRQPPLD